jgi:aspartate ammonia-lyase
VKVALRYAADRLLEAMGVLRIAFTAKAATLTGVVKVGRTQMQDAVPMTLGQEFTAYAVMIGEDEHRLAEACRLIEEVNLGGTAIGTRLNAPPRYCELACRYLSEISGISLVISPNLIEATQDPGSFVQISGVLKRIAVKLSKICNDLRLLSSGPRAGLNEINLPPVQAGSSIMPGKVNPVIPEVVNQIAFEVIGNDVTVSFAAEAGQLQLNAFEPIIAHSLFESITHLEMGCRTLAERCVGGITANVSHLRAQVQNSIGLATALNPIFGYAQATAVAQEAAATGRTVPEIVLSSGLLSKERLDEVLSPEALAGVPAQSHPPDGESPQDTSATPA